MVTPLSFLNLGVFLRDNQRIAGCALLASIGVTMSQLLLALLLGAYFEVGQMATSSKAFILQTLGLNMPDFTVYFSWLVGLIVLRGVFAWAQRFAFLKLEAESALLQKRASVERMILHGDVANEAELSSTLARIQSLGPGITKWASEGLVRPIADLLFVFFVAALMAQVNSLFAAVFFGVILFFGALLQLLSKWLLAKSAKSYSRKRSAFVAVNRALQQAASTRVLNREKPVIKQLHKRLNSEWRARQGGMPSQASFQAVVPVGFFCAMLAVLWCDFHWEMAISPSVFLVFILLGMYVQGTLRRLLKTPYRWARAQSEVRKWNRLVAVQLERQRAEKSSKYQGGLYIESIDPACDAELMLPISLPPNTWRILELKNRSICDKFLHAVAKTNPNGDWKGKLGDSQAQSLTGFQIRKQIAFVGLDFPLDDWHLADAICYAKDEDKLRQLQSWLDVLKWDHHDIQLKTPIKHIAFGCDDYFKLLLLRALMTKKKLMILCRFFDEMSIECAIELKQFLSSQPHVTILELRIKTI